MRKIINISFLALALSMVACGGVGQGVDGDDAMSNVVATVDGNNLTREQLQRDMPAGLSSADSVTFARMYIDSWLLKHLKMARAERVLATSYEDIDRLVEDYRQSLIMRRLDQYYVDSAIDLEVTDQQIVAHYRSNAASFKLDHNKVRGVVVKLPRNFRNTSTLTTALKHVAKNGIAEVQAFAEKHSLHISDMSTTWVSYSDFLSNLPTERSRSYDHLLSRSDVQQMSADDALFYFIITDVVRKGETAPLECVEGDIRRRLYAERRADIVDQYEADLLREAVDAGRIILTDSVLLKNMSRMLKPAAPEVESEDIIVEEVLDEEDVVVAAAGRGAVATDAPQAQDSVNIVK